jgi:transposase
MWWRRWTRTAGVIGVAALVATRSGYCSLLSWLGEFGTIARIGVEGTGVYGAGLARHLRSLGVEVIEVDRPNRQLRRARGKSDTIDAIEAARAVLSGRATGVAKTADGNVEAMRALLIAKRSGREARITCLNQIRHLGFTAPDELRERFQRVSRGMLAAQAAALRPRPDSDAVLYATKLAMRSLGRRVLVIDEEIARLEVVLGELVTATAPGLVGPLRRRCRHRRHPLCRRRRQSPASAQPRSREPGSVPRSMARRAPRSRLPPRTRATGASAARQPDPRRATRPARRHEPRPGDRGHPTEPDDIPKIRDRFDRLERARTIEPPGLSL